MPGGVRGSGGGGVRRPPVPADRVAGPFTSRAHSASRSAFRGAQRRRRVALLPVCQRAPGEHVAPLFPEGPSAQARLGALLCAFRRGRGSECVDFSEAAMAMAARRPVRGGSGCGLARGPLTSCWPAGRVPAGHGLPLVPGLRLGTPVLGDQTSQKRGVLRNVSLTA